VANRGSQARLAEARGILKQTYASRDIIQMAKANSDSALLRSSERSTIAKRESSTQHSSNRSSRASSREPSRRSGRMTRISSRVYKNKIKDHRPLAGGLSCCKPLAAIKLLWRS